MHWQRNTGVRRKGMSSGGRYGDRHTARTCMNGALFSLPKPLPSIFSLIHHLLVVVDNIRILSRFCQDCKCSYIYPDGYTRRYTLMRKKFVDGSNSPFVGGDPMVEEKNGDQGFSERGGGVDTSHHHFLTTVEHVAVRSAKNY